MTPVAFLMLCAAALLGTAVVAVVTARSHTATSIIYSATLTISGLGALAAIAALTWSESAEDQELSRDGLEMPAGLPAGGE